MLCSKISSTHREAGALDVLVKLLESAEDSQVAKNALTAMSSLVKNNPENKAAAREANGVQVPCDSCCYDTWPIFCVFCS